VPASFWYFFLVILHRMGTFEGAASLGSNLINYVRSAVPLDFLFSRPLSGCFVGTHIIFSWP